MFRQEKAAFVGATGVVSLRSSALSAATARSEGQILVDGDLWRTGTSGPRARRMYGPSDVFLFTGTVADNINMSAGLTHHEIGGAKRRVRRVRTEMGSITAPLPNRA